MGAIKRSIVLGASLAAIATAAVGVAALLGATRIPVAEYLLFPGSMMAWLYKGDNFRSSQEFLTHAIVLGVPINAMAGAVLGGLTATLKRLTTGQAP